MKKTIFISAFVALFQSGVFAQKFTKTPESKVNTLALESEIRFFASDEMLGRKTASVTNLVAGRYIAEAFRAVGLKTAPGQTDYLQKVPFENIKAITKGIIFDGTDSLKIGKNFIAFGGSDDIDIAKTEVVFVGYGWQDAKKRY